MGRASTLNKTAVQAMVDALGEPPNRQYVPMSLWARDHWSTLAYLECRVVDHKGLVAKEHMRADVDRHPGLAWRLFTDEDGNEEKCPTRLTCGIKLEDHDDWDCTDDMVVAGLIVKEGTGLFPVIRLTDLGEVVCAALRAHKGRGGSFGDFSFSGDRG